MARKLQQKPTGQAHGNSREGPALQTRTHVRAQVWKDWAWDRLRKTAKWAGIGEGARSAGARWSLRSSRPEVVRVFRRPKKLRIRRRGFASIADSSFRGSPGWQGAAWWLERVKGIRHNLRPLFKIPKPVQVDSRLILLMNHGRSGSIGTSPTLHKCDGTAPARRHRKVLPSAGGGRRKTERKVSAFNAVMLAVQNAELAGFGREPRYVTLRALRKDPTTDQKFLKANGSIYAGETSLTRRSSSNGLSHLLRLCRQTLFDGGS